ncbi:hypothetical protein FACS189431_3220 [Alphaproteobacteria bacterium]|nr:hypothetical protein FACS189431_3220 [Alphaproteobacteria bacterium]
MKLKKKVLPVFLAIALATAVTAMIPTAAFAAASSINATENGGGSWTISGTIDVTGGSFSSVTLDTDSNGIVSVSSVAAYDGSDGPLGSPYFEDGVFFVNNPSGIAYVVFSADVTGASGDLAITATATYSLGGTTQLTQGTFTATPPPTTYVLTVSSGSGSGSYAAGTPVPIVADTAPSGQEFDAWTGDTTGIADVNAASTTITTQAAAAAITATYKALPPATYALAVSSGSGSGSYAAGTPVTIVADVAPSGQQFKEWTTSNGGSFASAASANTTFTTPAAATTVTATYEPIPPLPDTTAPVISLNGATTVNLTVGDFWTDPGATVTDNVDPMVAVVVSGTVDLSAAGTYTLTYDATDAAGNPAISVTRTIIVNTAPVVPVSYLVLTHFGKWTGSGTATGTIDGDHLKFVRLTLAGDVVDGGNYTVTSGSTVITLSESYLKTLVDGDYTFVAEYSDGTSGEINLTIARPTQVQVPENVPLLEAKNLPQTGDVVLGKLLGLIGLAVLGVVGITAGLRTRLRRHNN